MGAKKPPLGAPKRGGRPHEGLLHGAPLAPLLPLYALVEDSINGHFGFLEMAPYPLGFPIKGGGEELSTLTLSQHTSTMHDLASSFPPREIVS